MSDSKKTTTIGLEKTTSEIEADFSSDTAPATTTASQPEVVADAQWPAKPYLIHNSNHQYQYVSQDNTTISNVFREEGKGWKDFAIKLAKEILLSVIEPDRFLKNAKAIVLLVVAYVIYHLSYDQIRGLIELYLKYK